MLAASCAWTLPLLLAATSPLVPGTVLDYRGQMSPVKEEREGSKSFELQLIVLKADADNGKFTLGWRLGEKGRGGWTWLDRYGRVEVTNTYDVGDQAGPALLWLREEGQSIVPLWLPLAQLPPAAGAEAHWNEGRLDFQVLGEPKVAVAGRDGDVPSWRVEVRSPIGHKRTFIVDKASPLVSGLKETVFLGQGVQHELKLELAGIRKLDVDELIAAQTSFDAWQSLREDLGRKPRSLRDELSPEQVAILREKLPALPMAGPLAAIAEAASADARLQRGRTSAVAALRKEALGKPLGEFELTDNANKQWTQADLQGKTVVLHFWEYRETPLEEPYGQVGYLDYLSRDLGKQGVVVLGVSVDPRLADPETRRAGAVAARKLRDFMNLSYPILLDDGRLLKRLGDPRVASAKLPLFVVIGADGKIAEYHAGLYDVTPQKGLEQLSTAVKALLK
jgi:peroxiredoxin